ncbi:MAG: 30S ribosomal protein S12 methylthiotransferase RimO [Phycisphaerae bacterium]|nr:30S ribosomal protein S12 methylthiotransferase RimO [Phycisphaerae bacterium]
MAPRRKEATTVGFVSLGCPKNTVDSERMLAEIAQAGLVIAADPDRADVVVINTCGFIAPAQAESLEAIRRAVRQKRRGRIRRIIVAGCLSERLGRQLLDTAKGVDVVMGLQHRDQIARVIHEAVRDTEPRVYTSAGPHSDWMLEDRTRLLIGPSHRAYLRVSEGCNRRCAFCTIPAIRGPFRSKSLRQVLREARQLADAGVKEVSLIGQDTTSYLRDCKIRDGLDRLLHALHRVDGLVWIRLMYLHPAGITDRLIERIAASDRIVRYMDIPVQHASDRILRAMRRPDRQDGLRSLVQRLRGAMPDVSLRTTVMVGFPGETDRDFEQLLDFIRWAGFDALGCFRFYPEPGTAAAAMQAQVPDPVKQERLDRVMRTQQAIAFAKQKARVGQTLTCLVDTLEADGTGRGRFYGQAPEIDSLCIVQGCKVKPGRFVRARVVDTQDYDLVVKPL